MLSFLRKRTYNTCFNALKTKQSISPIAFQVQKANFSIYRPTIVTTRPDLACIWGALFISVTGLTYAIITSTEEKKKKDIEELTPEQLTKKEAKLLIEEALKLDAEGNNEKALELYKTAYRIYGRANKASDKKLTLLRQRIAILTSLQGKDKKAWLTLMEGFQSVGPKTLTENLHFELYYDLCVMYYKFDEFIPSIGMFQACLKYANIFYPEELEIFALIHQFLGFSYYRRGRPHKGEEHLTIALKYLNKIKIDNKAFLYYSCVEFSDFYTSIGDYKKALLFLEEGRVLINQDSFFDQKTIEKGMKLRSPYTQKFIKDLRKDTQIHQLDNKARILRYKLGEYSTNNTKKNHTINKLTKEEKDHLTHGLLHW